jgi:acyl carrier protein
MHIMDSTGFLELVGYLEETYGIEIADEDMTPENLDSLDGVAEFVARKFS